MENASNKQMTELANMNDHWMFNSEQHMKVFTKSNSKMYSFHNAPALCNHWFPLGAVCMIQVEHQMIQTSTCTAVVFFYKYRPDKIHDLLGWAVCASDCHPTKSWLSSLWKCSMGPSTSGAYLNIKFGRESSTRKLLTIMDTENRPRGNANRCQDQQFLKVTCQHRTPVRRGLPGPDCRGLHPPFERPEDRSELKGCSDLNCFWRQRRDFQAPYVSFRHESLTSSLSHMSSMNALSCACNITRSYGTYFGVPCDFLIAKKKVSDQTAQGATGFP